MSRFPVVIHYPNGNEAAAYSARALCQNTNVLWSQNKSKFDLRDVLFKYKGKGHYLIDRGQYSEFALIVFNITLDVIMTDMIENNIIFCLPRHKAGKLAIITRRNMMLNRVRSVCKLLKFQGHMPYNKRYKFKVSLDRYYKGKIIRMLIKGHRYPTDLKKLCNAEK